MPYSCIDDASQAVENLDEDDKRLDSVPDETGQQRKAWLVNDFGLFSLILNSRKPLAKEFKHWVSHELLPGIQKAKRIKLSDSQLEC